jgi:hypothetical protein
MRQKLRFRVSAAEITDKNPSGDAYEEKRAEIDKG